MKYRPEIDGLRAIAILPVILFHAGIGIFGGGYVGVDIFFVISGFLIASLIIQDIESNNFSISSFYERRARRLLPALIFTLIFISSLSWLLHTPDKMRETFQQLISNAFFTSNFHYTLIWDYFSDWKLPPVFLNTWSLAVEEQFYLIIPLILMLFSKNIKVTVLIILALTVLSILWMNFALETDTKVNYYLLPSRFWELAIGVLLAYFCYYKPSEVKKLRDNFPSWLVMLLIASLIIFCIYFTELTPYPSNLTIPVILATAVIILIANENDVTGQILSNPVLVYIGKISYPLYLLHFPLIIFSKDLFLPFFEKWQVNFLAVLITFLISMFVYHFIEKNFRSKLILKSKKAMLLTSASSLLLIASIGYLGHTNAIKGRLELMNPELSHINEKLKLPKDVTFSQCAGQSSNKQCHLITSSIKKNNEKFLIVGDSFAANLMSPLWVLLKDESNLDLKAKITFACSFMPSSYGRWGGECGRARTYLENLTTSVADNIIFHINYQSYLDESKNIDKDLNSLTLLFKNITQKGIKIHVIGQRETFNFSPTRAFAYPWLAPFFEVEENSEILEKYYELWRDQGVSVYLKNSDISSIDDSYLYYVDEGHMSFNGGVNFLKRVGIQGLEDFSKN
tara:strand:+ start:175 stop:2049 length:1875 start_codon:yes stop_codon:yes gene_type:complete